MYKIFTDGGARGNPGKSACAYVIYENDKLIDLGGSYLGINTNNFAEYNGLLLGLKSLKKLVGIDNQLDIYMDSNLVVNQVNGKFATKAIDLIKLHSEIKKILALFKSISINYTPRENNSIADKIVNLILDTKE